MATSVSPTIEAEPGDSGSLWRLPGTWRLAALTALGFTSFFLTLASLPSWAVRVGTSSASAGLVTAVMLGCTVVLQMAVPVLERRLGTPTLLVLGLLALGAPAPLYRLSHDLGWLVVVSAVRGLGFAVLTVIGALLSTSVAPPRRRGEAVGIYGLCIAVPSLLAVPAGTALTSSGHFGWVAVLAACPLLAISLPRHFAGGAARARSLPARFGTADAIRSSSVPSLVLLVVMLAGGGILTFLPIARPHGPLASVALLVFGVSGSLSRWRIGVISDRIGSGALLPAVLAVGAIGLVGVAVALPTSDDGNGGTGRVIALLAGAAIFGVGYGATQNLTQIVVFERAGTQQALTASAVWNASFDAGTALGAYGVGLLAATGLQLPGTYLVCAALLAAAVPAAAAIAPRPS